MKPRYDLEQRPLPGVTAPLALGASRASISKRNLRRLVEDLRAFAVQKEIDAMAPYGAAADEFVEAALTELGVAVGPSVAAIVVNAALQQMWGRFLSDKASRDNQDPKLAQVACQLLDASTRSIIAAHNLSRSGAAAGAPDPLAGHLDVPSEEIK